MLLIQDCLSLIQDNGQSFRMRTGNIRPYRTQKKQTGFCAANLSGRSGYYKNRKHRKRSIAKKFARYNGIYLSRGSYRALWHETFTGKSFRNRTDCKSRRLRRPPCKDSPPVRDSCRNFLEKALPPYSGRTIPVWSMAWPTSTITQRPYSRARFWAKNIRHRL